MMADDDTMLTKDTEIDEAYIHPNPQRRSTAKAHNSQIVFGMIERGGRAKVKHVKSSGVRVLVPEIEKSVSKDATVYTDEHGSYRLLNRRGYKHETVNHGEHQYVVGRVHTQNVENFWSIMKPGLRTVYRHVAPKYLQQYANEYAFRYSNRKAGGDMFELVLAQATQQSI